MEILYGSYFNTSTQAAVGSNTTTISNLFKWDDRNQYASDGFANDLTTTTITISFSSTLTINRIAMIGHNLKDYLIYYNGASANTFSFTSSNALTGTSDFSSNSETSQYFVCANVDCTSVSIDMSATITANQEKAIAVLFLGESRLEFERVPSSKNYKPSVNSKQIEHKMADGSIRIQNIAYKRSASISYKYISQTFRDNLYEVYRSSSDHVFVAFGTMSGWDKFAFPCVWPGNFDFYKYSDNAAASGFGGSIKLIETTY